MNSTNNVLGESLELCSCKPKTGYFRDGYCRTAGIDMGKHTICAVMTEDFLTFTETSGNDLSTPRPEFDFPGLKPGDRWCLCALRWKEAWLAGCAPLVVLESCEESALESVPLEVLKMYATTS
ncbi:DUF2237 family protein [Photobacterium angustum]|uniref:DUF2237 domain-containing protein n=1 Tax=Photobacterium angustum TaxID=661 RepID=A0ABX5H6B7_PHOAN|nr:DUF2237 domain-containing protein [Photobacterium angustum]KJG17000.1 hypothetical protein UA33_11940 [Photobacterium angustum]KJG24290.1 hypothetical protein UA39_09005 [Photobacterium angustum]KJG31893.1 hypothetical protein UA36_09140 [Photobacterium angustum]KJG38148.1 hypothetical protein UA32_10020 [Photobacterium angustum]PSW96854.1 DUF2237 domain-containing protein [Photobacterium angustum]